MTHFLESIPVYLKGFSWNSMKYRTDRALRELYDTIMTVFFLEWRHF